MAANGKQDRAVFFWIGTGRPERADRPDIHQVALCETASYVLSSEGRLLDGKKEWYKKRAAGTTENCIEGSMIQVACNGRRRRAGIGSNGKLFEWMDSSKPEMFSGLANTTFTQVACGCQHSVALTSSGAVFTWGSNEDGAPGLGTFRGSQPCPKEVDALKDRNVVLVSAGAKHTAAVLDQGELYTWGDGALGRLGLNSLTSFDSPQLVVAVQNQKVIHASCGNDFTAILTARGSVYTCGNNCCKELGIVNSETGVLVPTLVEALSGVLVTKVSCGYDSTVALSDVDEVYVWGDNKPPTKVEKFCDQRVVDVAAFPHVKTVVAYVGHQGSIEPERKKSRRVPEAATLESMVNSKEFADVVFVVENEQVHAHRVLLCCGCPFFSTMFRSGMQEANNDAMVTIPIPNVRKRIFLLVLEFVYTGRVCDIDVAETVELFQLADMYQLKGLCDRCCSALRSQLTITNAAHFLQASSHSDVLKEVCLRYWVSNLAELSKTDALGRIASSLVTEIVARYTALHK